RALYFQERPDAALALLDTAAAFAGAAVPSIEFVRVRILAGTGQWDAAERIARRIAAADSAGPFVQAEALRSLWHLALVRGRLTEAEALWSSTAAALERVGATDALVRARIQYADARRTLLGD